MRDASGRVIEYFGTWWVFIGWSLLGLTFIMSIAAARSMFAAVLCLIFILLWVVWTVLDIAGTYQPKWVIAIGVAWILVSIILPAFLIYGRSLLIILWIAYMVRVISD